MAEKKILNLRIKWLYTTIFLFTILLLGFCVRWQIIKANSFKEIADQRIYSSSNLTSFRGSIYAKDGTTLAYSEPRFDLYIWLKDLEFFENQNIQTREEFTRKIAPLIDTTPEALATMIGDIENSNNSKENDSDKVYWFRIAKSLPADTREKINALTSDLYDDVKLQGIKFIVTSKRVYPENQLASQVIGLTNTDTDGNMHGVGGIEEAWNGDLNPKEGLMIQESDASGNAIASALVATVEPKAGSEIYTSIDKNLQKTVEIKLKQIVEQYSAKSGTIIVMDPKTGEVSALANYPTYDPNLREATSPEAFSNRAIYDPIEIGSIMKVVTLATSYELGLAGPDDVVLPNGHDGSMFISNDIPGGYIYTWDQQPQPAMSLTECFIKSDNICFAELGKRIPNEQFYNYLVKFGVGQNSGIDLSGESSYPLKYYTEWNKADEAVFTYGHGYLINMVQAISAISVIPNKGTRVLPHIVTKVIKADGEVKIMKPTAIENVISEKTAAMVSSVMQELYQRNVAQQYYYESLKSYKIGWKTGSAVIADSVTGYDMYQVNNTVIGFDASEDAKFIMLLMLEKPTGGISFYNVVPAWLDLFNAVKDELGMLPTQ